MQTQDCMVANRRDWSETGSPCPAASRRPADVDKCHWISPGVRSQDISGGRADAVRLLGEPQVMARQDEFQGQLQQFEAELQALAEEA